MNTSVTPRVVFPGTHVLCSQINNGHPARVRHYDARQHFDSQSCIGCGTYEYCQPVVVGPSLAWELSVGFFWPFRLAASLREVFTK